MNHRTTLLPVVVYALALAGCASVKSEKSSDAKWDIRHKLGWKSEIPEPQTPTRIVSTWSDTTLRRPGQPTQRGFGGRLVFFNDKSEDPIRVEGQLVVYAYDETDRPSHETHPEKRYIFPLEQFARHESTNKLGPSYSVWLPWDEAGGLQRNISLIARFEPKAGGVVLGEQTKHLLPGVTLPGATESMYANASRVSAPGAPAVPVDPLSVPLTSNVQQASYAGAQPAEASILAAASAEPTQEKARMATATIPLPTRLAASLQQAPPPASSRLAELRAEAAAKAAAAAAHPPDAIAAPPSSGSVNEPLRPGAGSSRDFLHEKFPARGTPAAPLIPDRAR